VDHVGGHAAVDEFIERGLAGQRTGRAVDDRDGHRFTGVAAQGDRGPVVHGED